MGLEVRCAPELCYVGLVGVLALWYDIKGRVDDTSPVEILISADLKPYSGTRCAVWNGCWIGEMGCK